jgi:prophage antirepressor-like protein
MNKSLTIFDYEQKEVRTAINEKGEPLFCLKDVCEILELSNVSQVNSRLDPNGVISNDVIDNMGRKQTANFINEPNLYNVIFQSRKDTAKKFQDWIYNEVLPSIRKTGQYSVNSIPPKQIKRATQEEIKARDCKAIKERVETTSALFKLDEIGTLLFAQGEYNRKKLPVPHLPQLEIKSDEQNYMYKTDIYKHFDCVKDNVKLKNDINKILTDNEKQYAKLFAFFNNGHTGDTLKYKKTIIKLIEKELKK